MRRKSFECQSGNRVLLTLQDLIGEAAAVVETLRPAFQVAIDQES